MVNDDRTDHEKMLSDTYSKQLGIPVVLYKDGNWICDGPKDTKLGIASTPADAVRLFMQVNMLAWDENGKIVKL